MIPDYNYHCRVTGQRLLLLRETCSQFDFDQRNETNSSAEEVNWNWVPSGSVCVPYMNMLYLFWLTWINVKRRRGIVHMLRTRHWICTGRDIRVSLCECFKLKVSYTLKSEFNSGVFEAGRTAQPLNQHNFKRASDRKEEIIWSLFRGWSGEAQRHLVYLFLLHRLRPFKISFENKRAPKSLIII